MKDVLGSGGDASAAHAQMGQLIAEAETALDTDAELAARLDAAQIAWARVSSVADLSAHPQLRRATVACSAAGEVSMPALAASWPGQSDRLGDVPTIGQHTDEVRREFGT